MLFAIKTTINPFVDLLGGMFGLNSGPKSSFSYNSPGFALAGGYGGTISLSGARASGGPVEAGKAYLVGESLLRLKSRSRTSKTR
ncbi:MAG: hypothetical protein K0Q77_2674 [Anaerosporomusa subterranea]|jgi:hypothetical protein|nr:hypothetical protein [Anaerosporomusa subterranea]